MRHPDWQFWRHSKWRLLKWTIGFIVAGFIAYKAGFDQGCYLTLYLTAIAVATPMVAKFHRDMEAAKNRYSPGDDGAWYDHSLLDAPDATHTDGIFNPGYGPNELERKN